jgi:peroxisomal 2,4-dienoyl-CoA reductase
MTGGATGIMRSVAERLVQFGASVAIMSRKKDKIDQAVEEIRKSTNCGGRIFGTQCDVRKYADCERAVEEVLAQYKKINHLINGAAGNFLAPFDSLSANAFRTVLEIDTMGTFNMSKAVYSKAMRDGPGTITNISATLHYSGCALQIHAGVAKQPWMQSQNT